MFKSFTTASMEEINPQGRTNYIDGQTLRVSSNPSKGYNYAFFLYIPNKIANNKNPRLLVEPNNTGLVNDDMAVHEKRAQE